MDLKITELTPEQLPTVIELCGRSLDLPDDATEAAAIVETLWPRAVASRPVVPLGAYRDDRLIGVLLGSVSAPSSPAAHVDLVAVEPAHRRQGVARALVSRAEQRLAGLGAQEVLLAGNPPYYAWPGIDVRYTPAICAAEALGYARDSTAWNMTADLSSDESPALRTTVPAEQRLADQGVTVRRAEPADLPVLTAFASGIFDGTWAVEVAESIGRDQAGCHLAERDGDVLGFAAWGSSRPGWFGPMGTAPAAAGSGIGGVLLRRCLADQRAAGITQAQIGWVGPVRFYSGSAGAWIERVFFGYRRSLRDQ
ncbi:GNAT family N-acetyltransferase [Salinispora tropica]|uniref:GNAT family N-acetyltransferase n=1 Tax=Salinispora tropica TaxID=168695 RepID=UPI0004901944|nr:GNAT family N-acetyltransferase [Salinispora tropica]